MMSNPPSSLQPRQRLLHRRQNSTPVAFEAMKVQHPATIQRQNSQHRRGQSIDSRSPIRRQHHHTGSMVSITNLGSTPYGQQILREAQQQRISRPGQQQHIELPVSPQCGAYIPLTHHSLPTSPYDNMTMNAVMPPHGMPAHSHMISQDFGMPMSAGLPVGFAIDENNHHYFQDAHMFFPNMGAPLQDRRMSHPELRIRPDTRPFTPTQQLQTAQFPLTPAQTPFRAQSSNTRLMPNSSMHYFQDEEIKSPYPVSMQKSRSLQGIVEQEELAIESSALPTTFEEADISNPTTYAWAPEPVKQESKPQEKTVHPQSAPHTPVAEDLDFQDESSIRPALGDNPIPNLSHDKHPAGSMSPNRPALSPRRMSISDLNLEPGISASIEETNVTLDDIAQYIEGPAASDNKWICRFDDCNKRFGRKENIKSHVQTHLGDRQFKCDHCNKCFVRGHDLKRHAKIHTGTKPYPCLCGNAFARHDALTRHRQRGMCIGAFDGIVKKVIKRGRPRKHRPEMDERMDKANKVRRSQHDGHEYYASSASSCSMSSWGSPPTESMDALSIRGQSPYDDMNLFDTDFTSQTVDGTIQQIALPPNMFSFTPPTSPGYSTGNKPSPSYRELSPAELTSFSNDTTTSKLKLSDASTLMRRPIPVLDLDHSRNRAAMISNGMVLQHSQQSVPSLSHSSSSPAPENAAFDFVNEETSLTNMNTMGLGMNALGSINENGMLKIELLSNQHERNDFDNFLDFSGVDMGLDGNNTDSFFAI